jgi:hypothetical protein
MVGATATGQFTTSGRGRYFMFGGIICLTAVSRSKVNTNGKVYVERWTAKQNVIKYMGEFINNYERMRPVDNSIIANRDKAAELIQQGNALVARGQAMITKALGLLQDQMDTELNTATTKVMRTINNDKLC